MYWKIYVQKIAEWNHETVTLWFLHYCRLVDHVLNTAKSAKPNKDDDCHSATSYDL